MKIYLIFLIGIFLPSVIMAAEKGDAEVYKVTMTRFDLCQDKGCENYTNICASEKTVDIASVSGGAEVGDWCPITGLTVGTRYTHVRVHVNRTFTMKGVVLDRVGTSDCFTQDDSTATLTTIAPGGLSTDADTIAARVEQKVTLINGNGSTTISNQASGQVYTMTNSASDRPDGSTAWCFGTSSTHATPSTLCTDANTTNSSPTWDDNANANIMQIIYPLTTSFTAGIISPKVKVAFSTADALYSDQSSGSTCELRPGSPQVSITLTE